MNQHRATLAFALSVVLILGSILTVSAQEETSDTGMSLPIEGGVKVPLSAFLSVRATDQIRLEASVVLPGFSAPLVDFEAMLTGRFYPALDLTLGDLPMKPYIGGGGLFISSLGQAIPGITALIGSEFVPADIPLVVFFESAATLPMTEGSTSIVFSFSIGARYSFGGR